MTQYRFDTDPSDWQEIPQDPELSYKLRYDFKLLGHDLEKGAVDFVLRFAGDGGHCQRHRHLADTTIMVLEGEQHLFDLHPDGSTSHRVRQTGEYARGSGPEELAHMERGGP